MDFCDGLQNSANSCVEKDADPENCFENNLSNNATQWKTQVGEPWTWSEGSFVSSEVETNQHAMTNSPKEFLYSIKTSIINMCQNPVLYQTFKHLNTKFRKMDQEHLLFMLILKLEDPAEFSATNNRMSSSKSYPKMLSKEQIGNLLREKDAIVNKYANEKENFSTETTPVLFKGDLLGRICDPTRQVSERYIRHARAQLSRDFPLLRKSILNQQLEQRNFLYYQTLKHLWRRHEMGQADMRMPFEKQNYATNEQKDVQLQFPTIPDIDFFMEYAFVKQRDYYIKYTKLGLAVVSNTPLQIAFDIQYRKCGSCGESQVLIQKPLFCVTHNHIICHFCATIRLHEIIKIKAKPILRCEEMNCQSYFSVDSLYAVLSHANRKKWTELIKIEQINYFQMGRRFICPSCVMYKLAYPNAEDLRECKCYYIHLASTAATNKRN